VFQKIRQGGVRIAEADGQIGAAAEYFLPHADQVVARQPVLLRLPKGTARSQERPDHTIQPGGRIIVGGLVPGEQPLSQQLSRYQLNYILYRIILTMMLLYRQAGKKKQTMRAEKADWAVKRRVAAFRLDCRTKILYYVRQEGIGLCKPN
jgi:hypothetical protein